VYLSETAPVVDGGLESWPARVLTADEDQRQAAVLEQGDFYAQDSAGEYTLPVGNELDEGHPIVGPDIHEQRWNNPITKAYVNNQELRGVKLNPREVARVMRDLRT